MPLVSIVTMNHNYGCFLRQCIASVQAQTFRDFEHIVVNAGCSDSSAEITTEFAKCTPVTAATNKYYQIADIGLCGSRNYGMQRAQGKYLVNLDADDYIHPQFLEKLVAEARPQTIVCPGLQEVGEGRNSGWPSWGMSYADFCKQNRIFCCSMFCKADWEMVGGYDLNLNWSGYEDWELWCNLTKHGAQVKVVPELLFYYRVHRQSSTVRRAHLEQERVSYIKTKHHA